MRRRLYNKLIENYTLNLVIGEDIPNNVPREFHIIKLYVRNKDNTLKLYEHISLFYLINESKFINIEGDPRYIFKEKDKYMCEVIPLGDNRGVYRILNGEKFKIMEINPLFELDSNVKTLKKNI